MCLCFLILHTIVTLKLVRRKWYHGTVHRVNTKNNRVVALRVIAYSVTILLSIITTVLLLLIALGYRFNSQGEVIHSGLLLVDNKPEAAQIYINGELKDAKSPGRFVLPIGGYELSLELNGYRGWKKNYDIKSEVVERVDYPLLIPKKLEATPKLSINSPQMISQSPNNKLLVYYVAGENVIKTVDLSPTDPKQTQIVLPDAFSREAGSVGTLSPIEWSQDSKKMLISQTLPSGTIKIVSLDINKPEDSVNITDRFSQLSPRDLHYQGSKTDFVYGLNQGILRRYNITNGETAFVLDGVLSYQPFADKTIAYTRLSTTTNKVEAGVLSSDTKAVLERFDDTAVRPMVAYSEFDQHSYLVVVGGNDKTRIYRDALNKPILKKQIPYITLDVASADFLKFSPNNQYLVIRSGVKFTTFDFENVRRSSFDFKKEVLPSTLHWMNDSHLAYQGADGQNYLIEFDGQNKAGILSSNPGTGIFYSSDFRSAFRVNSQDASNSLDVISLTAK